MLKSMQISSNNINSGYNHVNLEPINTVNPSYCTKILKEATDNDPNRITEVMVKEFIQRGGIIQILGSDKKITLNRSHYFIPGCEEGINRSQAARAWLLENGCSSVSKPLAGASSCMNQQSELPWFQRISNVAKIS